MSIDIEGSEVSGAELALDCVRLKCMGPGNGASALLPSPITEPPLSVTVHPRECLQACGGTRMCLTATRLAAEEPQCSETVDSPGPAATSLMSIEPCRSLASDPPGDTVSTSPSRSPTRLPEDEHREFVEDVAPSIAMDASCPSVTSSPLSHRCSVRTQLLLPARHATSSEAR